MRIRPDWKLSCFQRRFAQLAHFEHGGRVFRRTLGRVHRSGLRVIPWVRERERGEALEN
jgi:hypothetical protein